MTTKRIMMKSLNKIRAGKIKRVEPFT